MPIIINIYLIVLLTFSTSAFAYIGPGVGTGMIVTIIGIIIAFFILIFSIIYYPVKRLILKLKHKKKLK